MCHWRPGETATTLWVLLITRYSCDSWRSSKLPGKQFMYCNEMWHWSKVLQMPWAARKTNGQMLLQIKAKKSVQIKPEVFVEAENDKVEVIILWAQ